MPVKYNFVHNRKKKLDNFNETVIEMVCTLNRIRKYVSTGIRINPKHWNNEKREVRRSHPKHEHYNNILTELEATYYKFEADREYELRRQDGSFQLNDFNLINELGKDHNQCFIKYVDKEIERRTKSKKFQKRTLMGYTTFYNNLKKFKTSIPFHSIDRDFAKTLSEFSSGNFNKQGTRWTFEKTLKTFLNAAVSDNLLSRDLNEKIKQLFKTRKVINQNPERISLEEFKKFRNFNADNEKRQVCIDAFLIGCYTGLRISDVLSMSYEELEYDTEGNLKLKVNVIKGATKNNKKPLIIPINSMFKFNDQDKSEPVKIIELYAEKMATLKNRPKHERYFFDVSQPFLNRYLKKIATQCNFEIAKLTFHHSRNIFARLLHHHFGHSIGMVKDLLQHTDIKVTMIYETSNDKERENLMANTDWDLIK